jgi:hypothetical protein
MGVRAWHAAWMHVCGWRAVFESVHRAERPPSAARWLASLSGQLIMNG